ncbi:RDD family protein [Billgrantia pellis]|uniref:RDD family protein n=1 Tax=Billgrantia pellis TaxID=2606936 RepID=A0A7V7KH97_9GAMM|nr:RDD family protein [Halomonas pellis]KAA0013147.1 RDD family protein [Halomonas pellis]
MQRRFDQLDDVWPAGLGRRLGAMLYDAFLVAAIWVLIGVLQVAFVRLGLGLDAEQVGQGVLQRLTLQLALLVGAFLFFAFFWMRGGMTLGMQAWRLRVQTRSGHSLTLRQSLVRYVMAWLSLLAFGLGYLWVLFDTERRSWSDIASGTRVVVLPKPDRR